MKTVSPNGLNGLPIDSLIRTFGFGAEAQSAIILSKQKEDGSYAVALLSDRTIQSFIWPDEILSVKRYGKPSLINAGGLDSQWMN